MEATMKSHVLVLALALGACAQTTATPEGPLLGFDRKSTLPSGVDLSATLVSYSATASVCAAPPFAPAKVTARWRVARQGEDLYVVDGAVELLESAPQLVLEAQVSGTKAGESLTPGAPWLDVVEIHFKCRREAFRFPKRFDQRLVDLMTLHASGRDAERAPENR